MARFTMLDKRYHVGKRVFYQGDVVDLDKYPELAAAMKTVRAPKDKMVRADQIKTK